MIRLGVDVIETDRIRDSFLKLGDRFKNRIFTSAEQQYCDKQKDPVLHYAARFCAKEALSKALKTGIAGGVKWTDMEILKDPRTQAPYVVLHGKAKEFFNIRKGIQIDISLAHSHTVATASAVIVSED